MNILIKILNIELRKKTRGLASKNTGYLSNLIHPQYQR
jgi:hypothetical protein